MNDARSRVAYRNYWRTFAVNRFATGNCLAQRVRRVREKGFTIVETMIVLAVAMTLFISATVLVAGQQNKVEFSQAVRDIQSVMQDTINEVGAGYYPNLGNFSCSAVSNALSFTNSGTSQGSNTGCIFLGKVMQFGVAGTDPQQYVVHTVAALQDNTGTLASANPKDIAQGSTTNNTPGFPNASTTSVLHNGLIVYSMQYVNGGVPQNIGAVAFVSELGQHNSGGDLVSGTQQIDMVPVNGSGSSSPLSTDTPGVVDAINKNLKTSPVNPDGGVMICFQSGTTNQSGLIKLGSNNRTLSVTLDIKNSKDCT